MAKTYKRLGAAVPAASTYSDLYAVPASTSTVLSTISICNTASNAATFRLGITASATAASAIAISEHFVYDTSVPGNDTTMITVGVSMGDRQKLICRANSGSVAFNAWGVEIS